MAIIASCGHTLKDDEGEAGLGFTVAVKDYCRDWTPAVAHKVVCERCRDWYESQDIILRSEAEQSAYLHSNAK